MDRPVVTTDSLTKVYGSTIGVDSLNLELRGGEIFGLTGPNGSGKTTTIGLLLDLIRPTSSHRIPWRHWYRTENQMPQRMLEELSTEECWKLLGSRVVGRLAVVVAGKPDIFPVNYRVDNRTLLLRTAPGFKLAAATLSPAIAFEVDHFDEVARAGWSVVIHGRAIEVERMEELLEADDLDIQPWAAGQKARYLRIEPTEVTGRRIPQY